jgi:hypothetical protein
MAQVAVNPKAEKEGSGTKLTKRQDIPNGQAPVRLRAGKVESSVELEQQQCWNGRTCYVN